MGAHQVDDAGGDVLGAAVADLQMQPLVGEQRREVLEQDLVLGVFRPVEVDLLDLEQREVALAVLGRADLAGDGVAGAQAEAPDLARGDVDVVRAGQVGAVGGAQEAESVLQDLQHPVAVDVLSLLRLCLEDGEDEVLLAGSCHAFDIHGLSQLDQLGDRHFLQFGQVHDVFSFQTGFTIVGPARRCRSGSGARRDGVSLFGGGAPGRAPQRITVFGSGAADWTSRAARVKGCCR